MKRILAFVLLFTLIFTSLSIVGVEARARVSDEAMALATIGMLEGDGGGVTEEYMEKEMNRFTAAISILKLRGLYEDALNYKGVPNFVDIDDVKWSEGKRILAYLKANPDLGFIGNDRGEFQPYISINEQSYYKVLLETLGYKQSNGGVDGDFSWSDTLKYAKKIGLKPTYDERFTIDLLAKATVTALNNKTKTGKLYINVLIDAGKIKKSKALAAGLIRDTLDVGIKSVKALGNTMIEVVFDEEVDRYDIENIDNYSISGLTIKDVVFVSNNAVRLETSVQSVGKLYTLIVGEVKAKFTGIAKVSGSPRIRLVKSEDVETVVIEFDKELDFYSASNKDNYYISGVEIMEVEVYGKKAILTTYGLSVRKQYSIKVTNIKSIDGALLKSDTRSFYARTDTYPPTVKDVKTKTNQRVIVIFSEAVSKDTAENVENYTIRSGNDELDILKAELIDEEDDDEEDTVELTTEPQRAGTRYEITIDNISDKTKAANVMKKPVKKTFYGMREDRTPPQLARNDIKVLSRNHVQLAFTDSSRIDETTVLDPSNYEVIKNDRYKDEIYVQSVEKVSYDDGKYKVILNLDDLSINTNYTIKVYNIADEFGNVLEKNNSLSISVKRDDFAASTVRDYKVISGNEIEVYFTKPLNKDTAGDISNYEINNSIGYPLKATYKDEKLVLKTATMTEGKIYKLTINGVLDQAGNNLKLSFEFRATEGESDEISPRLEYIYSVNKYVVAAVFDEPVRYTTGGNNKTVLVLKSGKAEIELYAKALSDDNRVIEFSDVAGKKTLAGYGVYTVDNEKSLKGITDRTVNRNRFDTDDLNYYDFLVYGNYEEPEAPEIYYITQRDGKTFEMELSKEVVIEKNSIDTIGTPAATFAVNHDPKDEKIVTFTITSSRYIDEYKDYKIDISKALTDKHGIKVENTYETKGYTIFYGEYKDEDKPYIVDVTAIDRFTLEIEYNEAISYEGRYTIKNTDDTAYYKTISNSLKKIDKNKVLLSLSSPLEGRYDYRLIIDAQAKDLVGNSSEEIRGDEFYFVGTDLAPVNVPDVDYKDAEELIIELEKAVEDLSDLDKINRAKTAYSAANKEVALVKDIILKRDLTLRIETAGDKIQQAEDKLAAADVEIKISGLPKSEDITLEHKNVVKAARESYDALTENQKKYVENYDKLLAAEKKIGDLELEQQRLAEDKKRQEEDKLAAEGVIEKIEKLPSDIELEDKDTAEEAREQYNVLTDNQKKLVTNYDKLTAAEMEILKLEEEQQRLAEEEAKRKAEEEAKIAAAEEAAKALESAVNEDALGDKIAALSHSILEMEKALSAYLTFVEVKDLDKEKETGFLSLEKRESNRDFGDNAAELDKEGVLQKAIASADTAVKKVNEIIEEGTVLEAAADGAFDKLPESEAKSSLKAKIEVAKSKIENGRKAIEDAKMKIAEAKVKAAIKWLTADKFKFSEKNKADDGTPIILGLEPHKMGAVYKYEETNKTTDSKLLNRIFSNKTNSATIQIIEESKDGKKSQYINVTRGKEDAVITLRVKITSGNAIRYKLFNVNIPAKSDGSLIGNKAIIIVETPIVPVEPIKNKE